MSLSEYHKASIPAFGGMWNRFDPSKVPLNQALLALNCEFGQDHVRTRKGFGGPVNLAYNVRSMFSVPTADDQASRLVFFGSTSSLESLQLFAATITAGTSSPTVTALSAVAGCGGVFAPAGIFVLFASYSNRFVGASLEHGYVIAPGGTIGTFSDKAFQGALLTKPTLGVTGSGGVVTAGTHRV